MKFPEYWSKAVVEETGDDGRNVSFSCWRWSDTSQEDAHESALAVARRVVRRLILGDHLDRYPYGQQPLREEVIQKLTNDHGELIAAVTQNAYGSLVLNTAHVMFIDLDFPPISFGEQVRKFFARLFGKNIPSPEADTKQKLELFLSENPGWGCRVYRTFAGLRILVTHSLFDPSTASTRSLLDSVGADPLYIRLCQAQQCFRARLTPKPWRCRHTANKVTWPRDGEQQTRFEKWQSDYLERHSKYATCRFLGTWGVEAIHPEVEAIVEIHDTSTRCRENLDLA